MAKQSNRNKQVVRRTNPTVLKSRALEEFHEARESGRLIAFTGSMVNVHLGYPSWKKMIKDYFEEILDEKSKQETEDNVSAELTEVKEVFEPEDNIASLLEMMGGMITGRFGAVASLETQATFYNKHIGPWADHFFSDLEAAKSSVFYAPVGTAGKAFMEIEREAFRMDAG